MLNFILNMAMMNMLGGRWDDISKSGDGRFIFRCALPALAAGAYALNFFPFVTVLWIWFSVLAGSALWFPWGWSFDEITGEYSPNKYPAWLRKIGLYFFPDTMYRAQNIRRGILMKGIRGMYDIATFGLLAFVSPAALLLWPLTGIMGVIYWLCGSVIVAESVYGAWRGLLIALAIYTASIAG